MAATKNRSSKTANHSPVNNSCLPPTVRLSCFVLSEQSESERTFFMVDQAPKSAHEPKTISLTLAKVSEGNPGGTVRVPASRLLAYDQQMGFTRLKLTGGTVLDVKQSTDQIDRLVRAAASKGNPALQ